MKSDRLWAPWRIGYITNIKKEKGCLFCRVFKSGNDKKNFVFLRSRHALAMLNLYPYNNGHAMVAPVRHVRSLDRLNDAELGDIMSCLKNVTRLLDKVLGPEGYNIGINVGRAAGAGIEDHFHIHIVPRWNGDTNFMPTLSGTKVVSQSLDALYRQVTKKKI